MALLVTNVKSNAIFTLEAGENQEFRAGDLAVSRVDFDNSVSGTSDAEVEVIVTV